MDLKQRRIDKGLSRKALGDLVGVSPRTIERWEQGRSKPHKPAQKLIDQILAKNDEGEE